MIFSLIVLVSLIMFSCLVGGRFLRNLRTVQVQVKLEVKEVLA